MRCVQFRPGTRAPLRAAALVAALLGALLVVTAASAAPARPAASKATRAPSSEPPARGSAKPASAPRTLEDITIQGEIDVPQVLFITGRPRPFYDDRLHRLYRPTTRQLLDAIVTPQVVVIRPSGPTREASR